MTDQSKKLTKFKSVQEEAKYWDAHNFANYWDALKDAKSEFASR